MDNYRALLAIVISFVILIGYQYFFVGFSHEDAKVQGEKASQTTVNAPVDTAKHSEPAPQLSSGESPASLPSVKPVQTGANVADAKKVVVDTELYTATFSENGGAMESFVLKNYKETTEKDSPGKQLLPGVAENDGSLKFAWGSMVPESLHYTAMQDTVQFADGKGRLVFAATTENGVRIEKSFSFSQGDYRIDLQVKVTNASGQTLQGSPQIFQVDRPFQHSTAKNRYSFEGAAAYGSNKLNKIKDKDLKEGPQTLQGVFDWAGFESNYFICAIAPTEKDGQTFLVQGGVDRISSQLGGKAANLGTGASATYSYKIFYGPKKFSVLQAFGDKLEKSVDFGWFTIIARPTLALLNFFHGIVGNYGIAIILVTVIYKGIFWPITQRGLKSMKNMQKLQPKMQKIKEKYKDDPQAVNREIMNLYKTYKVNPLGGCLPMIIQIPVFFALYKVLLICIELRHAPFFLWITDLSAPDRLWIGVNIPWLGGIPVLTLLMGASMFLQQKMSPTTPDPTQARMMMMLPLVFTFMFLNFASGLVLYWFVNNLLSILQQYLINRSLNKQPA